jgi:protein-S-isoprenylcysteine O-methyltransferase Ste14
MVLAQMALIGGLVWPGTHLSVGPAGLILVVIGILLGLWALTFNRPGNFRIMPEVKEGARLIRSGPYRWVRHPMYVAVLLGTLGVLICQFNWPRLLAWMGLAAVLAAKSRREERLLKRQFPDYAVYLTTLPKAGPGWVALVVVGLMIQLLRLEGRIWWCACGGLKPWDGDIWSCHNSQHLFDPYSFTHALHGMLFFWVLGWILPRLGFSWRLAWALLAEAAWEVLENSPYIIQRYREATIGQGYVGDSIANSLADLVCCVAGVLIARWLGWRRTLMVFIAVEVILVLIVRDNLSLNILMLIWPIDAVKQWQLIH